MKKLLTILAALALVALCFVLLPAQAQAADVSDLTFTLNAEGTGYCVTDCKETAAGKLTIPATYEGKPVVAIGKTAFERCAQLTEVVIPDSVQTIGGAAFARCTNLVSVNIPAGVPDIASDTFYLCTSLASINIPDSVTSIAHYAFYYCSSLTEISIPESVYNIGEYTFCGCTNLKSVNLQAKVTKISNGVFYGCRELRTITIPEGVTSIGEKAFYNCLLLFSAAIPDTVTSIGASAFDHFEFMQFIYYCGTDEQWNEIEMAEGNENLNKAERSFHKFIGGNCETAMTCEVCGETGPNGHKWSAATCTEPHYCTGCNIVVRPALGHSWVDATCTEPKHCTACALTEGETLAHTYDNDADRWCNVCGFDRTPKADDLVFLQAPSLSFQDYIGMQLLTNGALAKTYDEIYVEAVQVDPTAGAITTKLVGSPYYGVYLLFDQQILSWSMTENVTLTLYGVKDGKTFVGQSYSASVESLALNMLAKNASNEKICRVLVDMLNYGAAVQTTFNHNAAYLPNTQLGEFADKGTAGTPEMSATNSETGSGSVAILQTSTSMQSKVEIQFLFAQNISAYEAKAAIGETALNAVVDTETMAAYGYTIVRVAIGAANMRDVVTFALYDTNGNPVTVVKSVSVEALVKNQVNGAQGAVIVAMMHYGDAVAAYAKG